jgi:hypothetical protein
VPLANRAVAVYEGYLMSRRSSRFVVLGATVVAATVAGAAVVGGLQTGCTSNCATNCPQTAIYIGSINGSELPIKDLAVDGPACPPPEGVYCIGDGNGTACTHFTITGTAEGACDVTIFFYDRDTEVVHTRFGPPLTQGCCRGHSIVGDSVFVISANSDEGISGVDGPTDAVTIVVDGGAGDANGSDGDGQ